MTAYTTHTSPTRLSASIGYEYPSKLILFKIAGLTSRLPAVVLHFTVAVKT